MYISTNPFSEGRAADIHARVKHVEDDSMTKSVVKKIPIKGEKGDAK